MRKRIRKTVKWVIFVALCLVGFSAFVVLACDEDPVAATPFFGWVLMKIISLSIILICVWIGKYLHKRGYLPECLDEADKEEV